MVSPVSAALAGIDRSTRLFERAAAELSDPEGGDLVSGMVALEQAKVEVKVNVEVLRTANEMTGTMLDIFA